MKSLKTKIKSQSDEATDFHNNEISKASSNHTCLAGISLDSALNKDGNYYPQVSLKECEYIEKEKKVIRHIIDDLERSTDDFDDSDEEQIKSFQFMYY